MRAQVRYRLTRVLRQVLLLRRRRDLRIGGAALLLVCILGIALAVAGGLGRTAPGSAVSAHPQAIVQPGDALTYASAREPASADPTPTFTPENTPVPPPAIADAALAAAKTTLGNAVGRPSRRIGLQAGHWQESELPDELASLRTGTGAAGPGWAERDVNLDIANRTARLLKADGFEVDLLPATVPVGYQADVFLALHCDASTSASVHGFKAARAVRSGIPTADDALVAAIDREYGRATGLPLDDEHITNNMRYYYALFGGRAQHAVAASTPAAILEMGFLTNSGDRGMLLQSPDTVAQAVVSSIRAFLDAR